MFRPMASESSENVRDTFCLGPPLRPLAVTSISPAGAARFSLPSGGLWLATLAVHSLPLHPLEPCITVNTQAYFPVMSDGR